jgi:hypothetical protein
MAHWGGWGAIALPGRFLPMCLELFGRVDLAGQDFRLGQDPNLVSAEIVA